MALYEVAVVQNPTAEQIAASPHRAIETLLSAPTALVANDAQEAAYSAVAALSEGTDLTRIDVLTRRFDKNCGIVNSTMGWAPTQSFRATSLMCRDTR